MQASSTVEQLKGRLVSCLDEEHNVIDMPNLIIVLDCLENAAVTKESLESTRLGLYVNDIRKRCQNQYPELSKKCRSIIKQWQKLLVGSAGGQTGTGDANSATSSPASVTSGASITPRLAAQHQKFGGRIASSPGLALANRSKLTPKFSGPNNSNHHHVVVNGHHAATPSPSPKIASQKTAGEYKAGKFNSSYAPSPGSSTVTCQQSQQQQKGTSPPAVDGAPGSLATPSLKIRIKMGGVTKDTASIIKSASVPNNLQNGEQKHQSHAPSINGSAMNNGSSPSNSSLIFTTAVEHPGISTTAKKSPIGQQKSADENNKDKTTAKDLYAASTSIASLTTSTTVVDAGRGSPAPGGVKKPRQKRNLDKLNAESAADPLALISQGCPLPKLKTTAALVAEMASVYPEEMARSITSAAASVPPASINSGDGGSPPLPPSVTPNLPPDGRRGSTQSGYTTPSSVSPPQLELYGRYAKHDDYLDVTKSELVAQYLKTSAFSDKQTSPAPTTSGALGGQWGEQQLLQQPVVKKRGRPRKNALAPSLLAAVSAAYSSFDPTRANSPPVLTAAKLDENNTKIYEPKNNLEQQKQLQNQQTLISAENDDLTNKTKKRAKMKNWYEILPPLDTQSIILAQEDDDFTNNRIEKIDDEKTGLNDELSKKSIDSIDNFVDKKSIKNVDKQFLDRNNAKIIDDEHEQNQRHPIKIDGFIDPCSIFNSKNENSIKNNNRALLDLHSRILMTLKKEAADRSIDNRQKIDHQPQIIDNQLQKN